MNKKKMMLFLYLFFLVLSASFTLALTKPIAGFVFQNDSSIAQNATMTVYVNISIMAGNFTCHIVPSVFSGGDGSFSTNLANLKFSDNSDCSGSWETGDLIWAEGNGSTVIPSIQGNGISTPEGIESGTGLQYIGNVTLAPGPDLTAPIVQLISPANGSVTTTGNVIFSYNVTDNSSIANCSLIFNGVINETDTTVTKDITQDFTKTNLPDGLLNWSINCTDSSGNRNGTETWILNISKIGILQATLINPTTDISVLKNQFFTFIAQVTCVGGSCGNVNATLDPITFEKKKVSFFTKILYLLKDIFNGNLITGMVTGGVVPTTPSTPFWTNSSNPANSADFPCLANMLEGSSCNTTWYVNATGGVETVHEFFAFFNSTTYLDVSNETAHVNITITEQNNPLVFDLIPLANTSFNISTGIEIGANVTDDNNVSVVLANITFPNGTRQQITLSNTLGDKYNGTFTIPNLKGQFNVVFIANDTSNNINNTETTFFVGVDNNNPSIFNLIPTAGSSFNISTSIQIAADVTDDVGVSVVTANITFPNGTVQQITLSSAIGAKYNNSFAIPLLLGQYNITFRANDTSNNINDTESTYFLAVDNVAPVFSNIVESPTDPTTYSPGRVYFFNI
ncbi:MAG: hypothetical protein KKA62_04580, partial [Nanoarchaeota archaeon]|nr:hypothetical protein [Nanoarchaeota archaeon]